MIEAIVDAVADRAVGEDAGEAMAHRVEDGSLAAHIEIAFMLSGEAGVGQVFRRRRRADRDGQVRAIFLRELRQRLADFGLQIGRQAGAIDDFSRAGGAPRQIRDVGRVQAVERFAQLPPSPGLFQRVTIGVGGNRESMRNSDTLRRESPEHFAERGVLSADRGHVGYADLRKETDETARSCAACSVACGWLGRHAGRSSKGFAQADKQAAVADNPDDPIVATRRQGNAPLEAPLRKLKTVDESGAQLRRQNASAGDDQRPAFDRRLDLIFANARQGDEDQHLVFGLQHIGGRLPDRAAKAGQARKSLSTQALRPRLSTPASFPNYCLPPSKRRAR
jgi:hypothetical protein